jgi:hypothetical protein
VHSVPCHRLGELVLDLRSQEDTVGTHRLQRLEPTLHILPRYGRGRIALVLIETLVD